jgi:hypothetical protein
MRSILRAAKNVVEQNTTKALAPTGVLWNPEPPEWAAEQLPFVRRCLSRTFYFIFSIYYFFYYFQF